MHHSSLTSSALHAWEKKGLIYQPCGKNGFDASHCHKPTPLIIDNQIIRLYFGTRDLSGKTRTTFIDVCRDKPSEIIYVHDRAVLDMGPIGAFDDSGANVSSVIRHGNEIYMYYIGWNPSTTVHTRNSIGLAFSTDGGTTFKRRFYGPILDRDRNEPYYTGAVDVIKDGAIWKMWYTSGSAWKIINGKPEIFYHIKYAESEDGIEWVKMGLTCIPPDTEFEATARPSVIKTNSGYEMWFSRRDIRNFRENVNFGYRGGYATSIDGKKWSRRDHLFGLALSDTGWDSEAIAYPYVLKDANRLIMFYNGNGFGKSGMGYAETRIKP